MSWENFVYHAPEKYKIYFYLVVAHSFPIEVLNALSIVNMFQRERYDLDEFVMELETIILNIDDEWTGGIDDSEPDVGIFNGLAWRGHFEHGPFAFITIEETSYLIIRLCPYYHICSIEYNWKNDYKITRNGVSVHLNELRSTITQDIKMLQA